MIVEFQGIVETKKRGCPVCGGSHSQKSFQYTKEYVLPSGIRKKFRAGVPVEVSDSDGNFLLSYNTERKVFERL